MIETGIVLFSLIPLIFLKFMLRHLLEGVKGIIIKVIIGLGAAAGAAMVAPTCAPLALFLVVVAIILGEFFGTLAVYIGPSIPWIGQAIGAAVGPIYGTLFLILILNVVLFILHILSIFSIISVIGWVILILNIAVPIIILYLIWGEYSSTILDMPACFGIGEAPTEIPGTGGIKIGTVT